MTRPTLYHVPPCGPCPKGSFVQWLLGLVLPTLDDIPVEYVGVMHAT